LDYFLNEEQKKLVATARKIADENIKAVRQKYDADETFPWDIVKVLGASGLCGAYIPKQYGGAGMGVFELVLIVEELSKADGGIALALAGSALGAYPILLGGSDEQKAKYLAPIAAGKKLAAFALTEHEAGSDATALRTSAEKQGGQYALNGTKCFITNGGEAEIYTVMVVTDRAKGPRGVSAFIVEKDTPGFTFGKKEKKLGIRASATRELVFENCRVPAANLISREGMGLILALRTFDSTRPGVAAQALGIAAGALDEAVAYAKSRVQFGESIASTQAIQHMLADMATEVEAARALLYATSRMIDGTKTRTTKESAMAKLYASDVAMRVTTKAIQIFGGRGYMHDYPVEKMMRDAKITQIYEGTNQIQRNEIALALIKEAASKE
jgi:alkylation response protein AidB-like acyl-CoA dehydrogenase